MSRNPVKSFLAASAFYLYNAFVTHLPFYSVRHLYLSRVLGIRLGKGAAVHMGCFLTGRNIVIGAHSVINRNCYLDGRGGIVIGENVSISPECYVVSLDHDPSSSVFATLAKPVVIGNFAWLGARAMIMPGVEMGEGAVAGAGAVVTASCGPYDIVAGSPARKIGERCRDLQYALRYFPLFNTDILAE